MDKLISAIIGFFVGRRIGSSQPKSLMTAFCIAEIASLVLAIAGNPFAGVASAIAGFVLPVLGVRCGGGIVRCLICGFFQFFFILGMLVAPSSFGAYFLLHLLSIAYPLAKAISFHQYL